MRLPIFVDMAPEVMQANMSYVPEPPWLLNSARIPSSSKTEDEDSHEDSGSDMAGEDYHSDSVEFITFSSDYCDSCWGNLPGEPLQKLDCEHFICDRCVVGIIILGLFSPWFSRPRCCDRSVRTKHFERVELLPHDLLTMWYSHREDADLATWTCPSGHVVHDLRLTDSDISIWEARIDCLQCPSSRATYCRRCRDPRCGNGEECRDFAYLREQVRRLYRDVILTRGGSSSIKAKLEICVETERMLRLEPSAHDFIPFKRSESTTFDLDLEAASTEFNREMRLIQNLTWASDYIRRSSVVSRRPKLGP
ncbi:hypothetical protein Micbo1qcDRAFT_166208 [Microdochium bolleyi]|uniref:RING-type domain-containing protein n=1 Tax=Microdochium bolleyi TaxID=196109 RepID=A0A136IV41_9PEZI|nr:hypothetical protein Micbo1qcDRAFT_166208 [Microdochium bolleyi]